MSKTAKSKSRRKWTVEEKIDILRKHFGKSKIVDTCEEHRVHPNLLNNWLKTVLDAGAVSLSGEGRRENRQREKLVDKYEEDLARKNQIIAELTAEVLGLKKPRGEA